MFLIREGSEADFQALHDLWLHYSSVSHAYLPPSAVEAIAGRIAHAVGIGELWVAEQDDEGVGYLLLHGNVICALFIQPEFRHQGIGTRLLEFARERADQGEPLFVHIHDNSVEGLVFFLDRGFRTDYSDDHDVAGQPFRSHRLVLDGNPSQGGA